MPDVLGYARVSTSDQDLEVQRRRLTKEGLRHESVTSVRQA